MSRYYLASRFDRQDELRAYARELRELGHTVTSRWLEEDGSKFAGTFDTEGEAENAWIDIEDMAAAECMIQFTGGGHSLGRHAELGWAIRDGMPLAFVGPREGIYHALPMWRWYEDWRSALGAIRDGSLERDLFRASTRDSLTTSEHGWWRGGVEPSR